MSVTSSEILAVLPIHPAVPFPGHVLPIEVGTARSKEAVRAAREAEQPLLLIPTVEPDITDPGEEDLFGVGVTAEIVQVAGSDSNRLMVMVRCKERVHVQGFEPGLPYLAARPVSLATVVANDEEELDRLAAELAAHLAPVLGIRSRSPTPEQLAEVDDPDELVDLAAGALDLPRDTRLELLAEADTLARVRKLLPSVVRMHEVVRMGADIRSQLLGEDSEARRQVLRERMREIKKELGEDGDDTAVDELAERVEGTEMPDEVRAAAMRELGRMRHMQEASPQFDISRTYVDWLLDIPWGTITEDSLDIGAARAILDADHSGLQKVKRRILEFIAVRKLAPDKQGPILCLVGPPGVGKTSLGKSIASALGRRYVRASLGGVRDEAAVRGHRRTYVGALPGRIASAMKKAGSMNPVFVLDEIDKLGNGIQGDPTAALLEVLDPAENHEFVDHYLEVPVDLSKVMFVATANQLDTIPLPLLDRMEVIRIPGYTSVEKATIGRKHLLPKQMVEHGLEKEQLQLDDDALEDLIAHYTREAGVRNLEREIEAICRAAAVSIAKRSASDADASFHVQSDDLAEILGPPRYFSDVAGRRPEVGVATGLAWTPTGGEILFVEARAMPGKGRLELTGQVGDVMRESALAAMSYIRANADTLGIERSRISDNDVHVHVPAGAVKKDGPSAGVALAAALVSLYRGAPLRHDVAMTGEITLRGKVLPVGGIKEKVLAAHRAGVKSVVLPILNKKDVSEIPKEIRNDLEISYASTAREAFQIALAAESAHEEPALPPPGTQTDDPPTAWTTA